MTEEWPETWPEEWPATWECLWGSGKRQELVGLPTGEGISGSSLNSARRAAGATRPEALGPRNSLASFQTGRNNMPEEKRNGN